MMSTNQETMYASEIDGLIKYFEQAENDPQLLQKMSEDPLAVLQSMNISVEDQFKEAVVSHMRAATSPESPRTLSREAKPMSAPVGVAALAAEGAEKAPPPEVTGALEFGVRPWGLVLYVREPAIKYLQGGGAIGGSVLAGIAAVLGATGPVGVALGVVLGICAAGLGAFTGILTMVDEGKGVCLTWTWIQLVPLFNPSFGIPVPTPLK